MTLLGASNGLVRTLPSVNVLSTVQNLEHFQLKEYRLITTSIYKHLLVLERKTHGRQLHLAKRFGPKRTFFSSRKGTNQIKSNHDLFCTLFYTDGTTSTKCMSLEPAA